MQREISKSDGYKDKLFKLIPGEAVIVLLLSQAFFDKVRIIIDHTDYTILVEWSAFVMIFVFIPVYLLQYQRVFKGLQLIFSTIGFLFWGMALDKEISLTGSILLFIWTFASPAFIKRVR